MFDINNDSHRKDGEEYIKARIGAFYSSTMYQNFWKRVENRLAAYNMRALGNAPVWKSKLYFATFFLGVHAIDAAFSQSLRQDPITQVGLEDGDNTPGAKEKALIAHYDINHDLYISRWRDTHNIMQTYLRLFGTAVGREYIVSDVQEEEIKSIITDQWGMQQTQVDSQMNRNEHTKTDAVHPLNFAHNATCSEFFQSRWASVRYPLDIGDIYKMLGDENYYQPGVKELINKMTGDGSNKALPGWTSSRETYYSQNETNEQFKNSIIVDEYSGDLNFQNNYDDNRLHFALIVKAYNIVLRMGPSPFKRHPYWKERCYPDADGPYGIDPCAALLPIGYLKNNLFNQYIDYGNANLKTMYEVYGGNIRGGVMSLIQGEPGGMIIADSEEAFYKGPLIRPVQKDKAGIPGIADIISYMDKYEQQAGPSSNLRGKSNDQLADTATGIGLMAQREDSQIAVMLDKIDSGIRDCMHLKMDNRIKFMTQPVTGSIQEGSPPMRYFPFELSGQRYTNKINRVSPDIQAGKYMSYLKAAMQFLNPMTGSIVNVGGIAKLLKIVGRNMGIDEVDEIIQEPLPPEIGPGMQQGISGQQPPPMMQGLEQPMPEQMEAPVV